MGQRCALRVVKVLGAVCQVLDGTLTPTTKALLNLVKLKDKAKFEELDCSWGLFWKYENRVIGILRKPCLEK